MSSSPPPAIRRLGDLGLGGVSPHAVAVTQINHGRAFYTHPSQIGSFMMVDYVQQRRRRR